MKEDDRDELLQTLSDLAQEQDSLHKSYEAHVDAWWNKLSENERQQAFYAVCKRIHNAEIKNNGTYRSVLYNEFGFGPEMYGPGMECGFFAIHNQLFDGGEFGLMKDAHSILLTDETETVSNVEITGIRSPEYTYNEKNKQLVVKYNFSGTGIVTVPKTVSGKK